MKGEWDGAKTGTEHGPSEGGCVSLSESGWSVGMGRQVPEGGYGQAF